jgi:uncharacterized membrane protein
VNKRALIAVVLWPLLGVACERISHEKAISRIKDDEETIKHASAAVNEVLRNMADCDVAKPAIAEAYKRIEEADKNVSAPATHQTLAALKAQVDRVAQACP